MITNKVNKYLLLVIESFSTFSNNNIGNTGGTRFAARCEPQKRNAKRVNNGSADIKLTSLSKPNKDDMNEGNKYSVIPRIDIAEATNK
jgi:hypothetical protein